MIQFLREEQGTSAVDWAMLGAGVLSLVAAIVADVYFAAMSLVS